MENAECKILWDFNIQMDQVMEARCPDLVVVDKVEQECRIVDLDPLPYEEDTGLRILHP